MKVLGIDIGTTSICCVVFDCKEGRSYSYTQPGNAQLKSAHTWEKVQDVSIISGKVLSMVESLLTEYPDIEAIGLTGQMHGILYLDSNGETLSPLYTWQDQRGELPFGDGISFSEKLSSLTGCKMSSGYGLTTHFYNLKNDLVPSGAVKLCTVMDFIALLLSGGKTPVTDASNAASLGLFDKKNLRFDSEALAKAGIDASILPDLVPSSTIVGKYQGRIPIVAAIGDNQASYLGSVAMPEKTIHITVGTSSQISVHTDKFIEVPGIDTRPLPSGGYIMVGAALCGGATLAVLNDFFCDTVKLCTGKEMSSNEVYKTMTSIAGISSNPEEILVDTSFNGSRNEPSKRGSITNITSDNLSAGSLVRGFVRGIGTELFDFFDVFPESVKIDKNNIIGSGNALRMNPLLRETIKGIFGLNLKMSEYQEEASMGACINAMVGIGVIDSFADFWKK